MKSFELIREQWVPRPLDEVFAFFSNAANLERLTPDWLRFEIVTPPPIEMAAGTLIEYRIRWRFLALRWLTEIIDWSPPYRFVDVQRRGPYALWHHTHSFTERDGGTVIGDRVRYALPLGFLGRAAHRLAVQRDLTNIFNYRLRHVNELFASPDCVQRTQEAMAKS